MDKETIVEETTQNATPQEVAKTEQTVDKAQEQAQDIDPKIQKEIEGYISGLSKMLHSKQSSKQVVDMLGSAPPEKSIPETALMVNAQMEEATSAKGKKPSLDVLLAAGIFLTNDLIEIGNAAGVFQIEGEQQVQPLLKGTLQAYIEKGLADGTMDPVELQEKVGPLMSEEHQAAGLQGAEMSGIPTAANEMTAMEQYANKREQKGMLKGQQQGGR